MTNQFKFGNTLLIPLMTAMGCNKRPISIEIQKRLSEIYPDLQDVDIELFEESLSDLEPVDEDASDTDEENQEDKVVFDMIIIGPAPE